MPKSNRYDALMSSLGQVTERSQPAASGYPKLIEVTLEELETGLESASFTSVDLVNVNLEGYNFSIC